MTKRFNNPKKLLPAWFKLENYRDTARFTAYEWYGALFLRKLYYESEIPKDDSDHNAQIGAFRTQPCGPGSLIDINGLEQRTLVKRNEGRLPLDSLIESVRIVDLFDCCNLIRNTPELIAAHSEFENGFDVPDVLYRHYSEYAVATGAPEHYGSVNILVGVDLDATDKRLFRAFKRWLASTRKKSRKEKSFTSARPGLVSKREKHVLQGKRFTSVQFRQWVKYAILPYIDLVFWAEQEGVKITEPVMGNAIFDDSDRIDVVSRIQKHTKPIVAKVYRDEIIARLLVEAQMQALTDHGFENKQKKNPKKSFRKKK